MELFFPFLGVFAVAIAAVASTACILIPGPPHLVTKVFFGTLAFIFGGMLGTIVAAFLLAGTLNPLLPIGHMGSAMAEVIAAIVFISFGAASSWVTIKLLGYLFSSLAAFKEKRSRS